MEILLSRLKECILTECLPKSTLENIIIPAGKITDYPKGAAVFQIHDTVRDICVLLTGKINLSYCTKDGQHVLHDSLLPPRLVGLDLICTKTKISPYMALAAEDSRIFSFPASYLLSAGKIPEPERQACVERLLMLLSQSNMKKEYRIAILTQSGLRDRIMTYLTMQANRRGSSSFAIPFNREELAAFLGVNRSALSHEFGKLRGEGIIDFRHNEFHILEKQ